MSQESRFIEGQTFVKPTFVTAEPPKYKNEGILTGQMRDTRRPVVAISLSGSKRSFS